MTTIRTASLLCASAALLVASSASARPSPSVKKSFEANKTFGLGLMLGSATGLSGKIYLGADTALDFGIGAHDDFGNDDGLQIHGDILWHPVVIASPDAFEMPLYLGVGLRYLDHDDFFNDSNVNNHEHLGVRVPFGMLIDFNRVPLDIFFEIAVVIDIVRFDGDGDPNHRRGDIDGVVGLRYYF